MFQVAKFSLCWFFFLYLLSSVTVVKQKYEQAVEVIKMTKTK